MRGSFAKAISRIWRDKAGVVLDRAGHRGFQQVEHGARKAGAAQILPGRAQRRFGASRVDFQLGFGGNPLCHGIRDGQGLLLGQRLEADHLENVAQLRAHPQQARGTGGGSLGPDDQAASGNGGQDLFEHACRLALVRAAERDLQNVGDVPDQLFRRGKLLDRLLNPPLKLSEILLTGHKLGAARLEYRPAMALQALAEQAKERRLPDPCLAGHKQRPEGLASHGSFGLPEQLAPGGGLDEQIELFGVRPKAAERGKESPVDDGALLRIHLPA